MDIPAISWWNSWIPSIFSPWNLTIWCLNSPFLGFWHHVLGLDPLTPAISRFLHQAATAPPASPVSGGCVRSWRRNGVAVVSPLDTWKIAWKIPTFGNIFQHFPMLHVMIAIDVWNIYHHLPPKWSKCRGTIAWSMWECRSAYICIHLQHVGLKLKSIDFAGFQEFMWWSAKPC